MTKTRVEYLAYHDGWQHVPEILRNQEYYHGKLDEQGREFRAEVVGWHCWVWPADDAEFEQWMEACCPTAECDFRFNSGDPMYTVHITDEHEATLFQLKWINHG